MTRNPYIVGIGGTINPGSGTECALQIALASAKISGATVRLFGGAELAALPHYGPGMIDRTTVGHALVDAVRRADGVIIASPGYHGTVSGLVKNAIDFVEETARDERVYLDGLPVGLIVTAYGWQATGTTLGTLRSMVHSLRGWPTPFGATIKVSPGLFQDGSCTDPAVAGQLDLVGRQVTEFAHRNLGEASPCERRSSCSSCSGCGSSLLDPAFT